MLRRGDSFDRYLIEEPLGTGGMGQVYAAFDSRLRRRVALKILRPDEGESGGADVGARVLAEARAAAAFQHPNAIAIYDVGTVGPTSFIAMEYIAGTTLRAFIGPQATVGWEQKLRWLLDVAHALSAAHNAGLVHRDVKPENVMVREDGWVKVLDFGIADEANAATLAESAGASTGKVLLVGSLFYMAPEQLQGRLLDGRTDQFSWGVLAYELFSGRTPWHAARDGVHVLSSILTEDPTPLAEIAPELSPTLAALLMRTLEKDPDKRFASMSELLTVLEPFAPVRTTTTGRRMVSMIDPLEGSPAPTHTSVRPVGATFRGERLGRRRALWPFVVLSFAASGAGALVYAGRRHTGEAPSAAVASSSASGPVTIVDLPRPSSSNPEALAAYARALDARRDASTNAAITALELAVKLDPDLAAAHLRLAILRFVDNQTSAREHYQRALARRAVLSEHDRTLLDAFAPALQRQTADWTDVSRRLEAALTSSPGDAEFAYQLGGVELARGDMDAAAAAFTRASDDDPKFASAWQGVVLAEAYRGRFAEALAATDRCLAVSQGATRCLSLRVMVHNFQGACGAVEEDARRFVAMSPGDAEGYDTLAQVSVALGRPNETVLEELRQKWTRTPDDRRREVELIDRASLDVVTGNFARAERETLELTQAVASAPDQTSHATPTRLLVGVYDEEGLYGRAATAAGDFLKRKDAWSVDAFNDDQAIASDLTPLLLDAVYHGGKLGREAFAAARDEWARGWRARLQGIHPGYVWFYGYAAPASTPDEAREALAALGTTTPPPFHADFHADAALTKVLVLAGDAGRARDTTKTTDCLALADPIGYVRAHYWLGIEREANGDVQGACDAFGRVVALWGAPKQRSLTGERARLETRALKCGQ